MGPCSTALAKHLRGPISSTGVGANELDRDISKKEIQIVSNYIKCKVFNHHGTKN